MRKIALITGSRGEYGYIRPVLREIENDPGLDYDLVTTNLHLIADFGSSLEEFERDGFRVSDKIYMALDGYTPASMSKSLGVFLMGVSDALARLAPDIVLLAGDRGEQLMAALAAAHMNIPVAHIQAGEVSGNIDGLTRHAIARFSHIHFASNQDAHDRLVNSGEQPFRVFLAGAPQLDELVNAEFDPPETIAREFGLDPGNPFVLMVQHPNTEEYGDTFSHIRATLEAVIAIARQTVVIFPNNDAGNAAIRQCIEQQHRSFIKIYRNLKRQKYLGLMNAAGVMVGNSSSGLIEAPTFHLPAVNVGSRQRGRARGPNVIDVPPDAEKIQDAICRALSLEFRETLRDAPHPYKGDGQVSKRIVEILRDIPIDQRLLRKELTF